MNLKRGYSVSAINEEIRDNESIRQFVVKLLNEDMKRGKSLVRISRLMKVNYKYLDNYYRYSASVFCSMYERGEWIRALAIRRILNYYGYDLSPVIVEKQ